MNIILYSTPTCGMCHVLKNKLKEKNINYSNIEQTAILRKENITHVPVLEVDNVKMNFKQALQWLQGCKHD